MWFTNIPKLYISDEWIVFDPATARVFAVLGRLVFGALHLLDLLVLSRDVLCIDLFCFLHNMKSKIHVFIPDLAVVQGFETLCTST